MTTAGTIPPKRQIQYTELREYPMTTCKKLLLALVVLAAAATIYTINKCSCWNPPKPPHVDLQEFWGPEKLKGKEDTTVRPFKVEFTEEMVKDLKTRLRQWRVPPAPLTGVGFRYGFNTTYLASVVRHWSDSYNFRERAQYLNRYQHYKTRIQGLDIHFIRARPSTSTSETLPLLLLHGWPGSVREFYEAIPALTKPGVEGFAFDLIVPSLPGYGWSDAAVRPGLSALEVSVVMRNLMHRLGFKKFYVQGGDWGSVICSSMITLFPDEVLGYHTNMPLIQTKKSTFMTLAGSLYPGMVVEKEFEHMMYPLSEKYASLIEETGYMHIQSTKPDTIGTALSDSPVGLLAYILEKFSTWTNPAFKGDADGSLTKKFALDDLLDNIMIYWSTNTITTSMRLYSETFNKRYMGLQLDEIPTPVPTWALKTPHELAFVSDKLLRGKFVNLLGSTVWEDGGHFAAFELPAEFARDVIKAVGEFRKYNALQKEQKKNEL